MADFTSSSAAGGSYGAAAPQYQTEQAPNQLVTLANIAGALISLALVVGIAIWGYKLLVRDVSGIPVVRAASGDMRVRPEEPGGQLAQHQGLSVNAVAAEGTAAAPADRLILAPKPVDLTDEDHVLTTARVAPAPQVTATTVTPTSASNDVVEALQNGNVDALVERLTEGVTPLSTDEAQVETIATTVAQAVAAEVAAAEDHIAAVIDAPGVRVSYRPKIRPTVRAPVTPAVTAASQETQEVNPASLPAGTRLAQLGAFDSPEVARQQWDQLRVRFDVYLADKKRIVQKATSGGRVFYRLRAMGFEDIADARQFCSALVAANADCIPVVTR